MSALRAVIYNPTPDFYPRAMCCLRNTCSALIAVTIAVALTVFCAYAGFVLFGNEAALMGGGLIGLLLSERFIRQLSNCCLSASPVPSIGIDPNVPPPVSPIALLRTDPDVPAIEVTPVIDAPPPAPLQPALIPATPAKDISTPEHPPTSAEPVVTTAAAASVAALTLFPVSRAEVVASLHAIVAESRDGPSTPLKLHSQSAEGDEKTRGAKVGASRNWRDSLRNYKSLRRPLAAVRPITVPNQVDFNALSSEAKFAKLSELIENERIAEAKEFIEKVNIIGEKRDLSEEQLGKLLCAACIHARDDREAIEAIIDRVKDSTILLAKVVTEAFFVYFDTLSSNSKEKNESDAIMTVSSNFVHVSSLLSVRKLSKINDYYFKKKMLILRTKAAALNNPPSDTGEAQRIYTDSLEEIYKLFGEMFIQD